MTWTKTGVVAVTLATALAVASIGPAAVTAGADSGQVPPWAPRQPAQTWQGQPVGGGDGDPTPGGHWGVWINGGFINLT